MERIADLVAQHEAWRAGCLNLIPSENVTSPAVRAALGCDLGHRYSFYVGAELHGHLIENAYRGTRWTDAVEARVDALLREIYEAEAATARPISGHIAGMTALAAFVPRGGRVMALRADDGGYDGYHQPFMPELLSYSALPLPWDEEHFRVDAEATAEAVRTERPNAVVLAQSFVLFPIDMAPIDEACKEIGSTVLYDGSHTLGLVAGGGFQPDAVGRSDVLFGSTHKTLFGPQGGLMVSRDASVMARIMANFTLMSQDNAHWNRIAALGVALEELKVHGADYARQVVANAKALGAALDEAGMPVRFAELGYTESHQIMLDARAIEQKFGQSSNDMAKRLETQNIIVDAVGRLGTQEVTRRGLTEGDMATVADLVVRAAKGRRVSNEVIGLVGERELEYTIG
jgi:glycine hydroxymethyltransferase